MFDPKRLQEILVQQKQVLTRLEQEADVIISSDLTKENERLKSELAKAEDSLAKKSEELAVVKAQSTQYKNALFEQVYSRKITILNKAEETNRIYFAADVAGETHRLEHLQQHLHQRAVQLKQQLEKHNCKARDELITKIDTLTAETAEAVKVARQEAAKAYESHQAYSAEYFAGLKQEQITDEVVESIAKKNSLEAFVGGNLINKIGIVFIILGLITVSRFAVLAMSDLMRALLMAAISLAFLVAGEFLNRKKPNVFSLGLTSTGVAGLYVSLSISYFVFGIVGMIPALILCILITAGAFALSMRYNSQTIAAFALVGGYIPMTSIFGNATLVYSAMVYFVVLNLFVFLLSFYKKWRVSMFMGFAFNLIGTIVIVSEVHSIWLHDSQAISAIIYVMFAFAIYTVIPIISNYRTKNPFSTADVVLLTMNTVISSIIMYVVLIAFSFDYLHGAAAVVFAITYLGLGKLMQLYFVKEKHTAAMFYITGLTFTVLVVPLQFDFMWLTFGWLVQAVLMSVYGILKDHRRIKLAGYIVGWLCFVSFVLFDITRMDALFAYRYLAVTLGSIGILVALAYKGRLYSVTEKIYKYVVLINVWFYLIYLIGRSQGFAKEQLMYTGFNSGSVLISLGILITFLFALLLVRLPVIADKGMKIISLWISSFGILAVVFYLQVGTHMNGRSIGTIIISTLIIVILCAFALNAMRLLLVFFAVEYKMSVEWVPFGISAFFLMLLTQVLVVQYSVPFTSIAISIIFVIAALLWIIFGFVKRYVFMRRFGLGLSILAVAKLFLVDLPGLTDGHRIVSYFAFGATLLGISFVYQYFRKHFVLKIEKEESGE